jgi:hypothetical protein
VLEYEQRGELGKFFPHTRSRHPRARRKRMTIEQRQLQIMSWRWETPLTDKQIEVEQMRLKNRWQKVIETYAMREP